MLLVIHIVGCNLLHHFPNDVEFGATSCTLHFQAAFQYTTKIFNVPQILSPLLVGEGVKYWHDNGFCPYFKRQPENFLNMGIL